MKRCWMFFLLYLQALPGAWAGEAAPLAADPGLEARVMAVSSELRCLVCQNQTIADSHAGLAIDLREQVRQRLARGESEAQVIAFMTQRYGDFVLYRPPVQPSTWLLWFGPALLLFAALAALLLHLARRRNLADAAFEPDPTDDLQEPRR
ncbi:cytochrome c-type biogenesis protein [Paucibacter sp. JuS9]|uniref:cytochrome c-type biogenesis protein n=1 Tax=Roseateles TaxID=93681 RepID=UPI002FE6BBB3